MRLRLELNRKTLWVYVLAILFAGSLHAQDITGNWQGTIRPPQGKPFRMVLQVTHDDSGALKARIYSIDQGPTGDWADFITLRESTVKFVVGMIGLSYEGKLSQDGNTIAGTRTQGSGTPFTFRKPTKESSWTLPIDPTSHTVQFVTVAPGVKLEVLDWGGSRKSLRLPFQ